MAWQRSRRPAENRHRPRGWITLLLPLLAAGLTASLARPTSAQILPLSDRDVGNPAHWYQTTGEPGLYPGGLNLPSGLHLAYGETQSGLIAALPSATVAAAAPAIGVVAVGMSNTNQEWGRFSWRSIAGAHHQPRVVLVDAAQGGMDAPTMDQPTDPYWLFFDQRVAAAGLGLDQIQVVWLKQSIGGTPIPYPSGAETLRDQLAGIVDVLRNRCPNLRVVYLSSRIWGNNEPWNFETAFAVKWLIADQASQIATGTASGPWLAWGPYLWADGVNPRGDGLFWDPEVHLEGDGTHPAAAGEDQVADLLLDFFTTDPRAARWFLPAAGAAALVRAASDDTHVDAGLPNDSFGSAPALTWATGTRIYQRFELSGLPASGIERAVLTLRVAADDAMSGGLLRLAASSNWTETTLTHNSAAALDPLTDLRNSPGTTRGGVVNLDVTAALRAAVDAGQQAITFQLQPPGSVGLASSFLSIEANEGPQLLISGPALFGDGFESADTTSWE